MATQARQRYRARQRALAVLARSDPGDALAVYIRSARAHGLTGREALAVYRHAGGRVRTATFYSAWGA